MADYIACVELKRNLTPERYEMFNAAMWQIGFESDPPGEAQENFRRIYPCGALGWTGWFRWSGWMGRFRASN
jgi:hypothetical protein